MRPSPIKLLDYSEFPLLYVDDEIENLRVFELTFRREFQVLTAQSAEEGLQLLNEHPVAVVLSDHRMPGMTGVEFLARARDLDPSILRILVTAYGDVETLQSAINDGSIYRYLAKPWEPEEMRLAVRKAIELYALDRERGALLNELTLINQLARALHRELNLEKLLALLLDAAHHELGFDAASLLFFDSPKDSLRWVGLEPDGTEVAERVRTIEIGPESAPEFIARLRAGEAQALRLDEADDLEAPLRRWVMEVCAEETLVVPLVGNREVIGAIAIDNRSGGRRFGADDRTLLDGLAMQAVGAIENAKLVDELKRSREQIIRADRLGTLGTLAAGLAHEINNPLVSVHTFLSLAPGKRHDDDDEFWGDYHALASSEVDRIRGLVGTMSRLGQGPVEPAERGPTDLGALVNEVVALVQRDSRAAGIALEVSIDPGLPEVTAVRHHLHQVFLNLTLNAVHATSEGGSVRLSVECEPEGPEDAVWLTVEDDGQGIPPEHLEKIFDPFFTTKDPDDGTGLGLMISHKIVTDHGGSIEVTSRPGEGACFRVRLPVKGPSQAVGEDDSSA